MSSKTGPDEPAQPATPDDPWVSAPVALSRAAVALEPGVGFDRPEHERYEPVARIGSGGMGVVHAALDRRLGRDVALKLPRPEIAGAAARLEREARITARLDHPGIVPVYDAGVGADGQLYYTMRLVRGRSLEEALAAEDSLDGRLRYLRQVLAAAEAIAHAHGLGVVHRDLTPRNIMVGGLGETQVVDWGLAAPVPGADAWARELGTRSTAMGSNAPTDRAGTPAYMAPEQADGAAPDPRADVWGLGAVLFRLVAGRPPFGGRSSASAINAAARGEVGLHTLVGPPELVAIVRRALSVDPAARYPSARELAEDLEAFVDGRRVSAHPYTPRELLQRLLRAWRVPLRVAGLAAILMVVLVVEAGRRIVVERDRAVDAEGAAQAARQRSDESLVVAYAAHASVELGGGHEPEAATLAAAALKLGESAEARGVLMALSDTPPRLERRVALPDCPAWVVSPNGRDALCLGATSVLGVDAVTGRTRFDAPITPRRAAFVGEGPVVVDRAGDVHWLDRITGDPVRPLDRTWRDSLNRVDRFVGGPVAAVGLWGSRAAIVTPGQRGRIVDACDDATSSGAVVRADGRVVIVCESGQLVMTGPEGPPYRLATRLGRDEVGGAVALLSNDELAVASVKGHLTVVRLGVETVRRYTLPVQGVNGLAQHGRWLLVNSPPTGARLLSLPGPTAPTDLQALAAFPRLDGDSARWDGDTVVLTGLRGLTRWTVPELPVRTVGRPGAPGVSQVRVYGDSVVVARGDGTVSVDRPGDPRTGRVMAGVVKDAAISTDGRLLYVVGTAVHDVHTLPVNALPCGSAEATCVTQPLGCTHTALRRVVALSSGDVVVAGWDHTIRCGAGGRSERLFGVARDVDTSPDHTRFVALGDPGGAVLVGDHATQRQVGGYEGAVAAAIGDNGEVAVAVPDRVVWLSPDGANRLMVPSRVRVTDVALPAPDRLVTGGFDGVLRVYDGAGAVLGQVKLHTERVSSLAPVAGGLWSASWDGTARRVRLPGTFRAGDDAAGLAPEDVLR